MPPYGVSYSRPLGCDDKAMGGAAWNLGLEALLGESDMITVFDDFNSSIKGTDTFGGAAIFEDSGWVLNDVGAPAGDEISMNDPSNVTSWAPSCIRVFTGTGDDAGGNMQLDLVTGAIGTLVGTADFPHLIIPETGVDVAVIDNTVWVFACRIGLRADLSTTGSGAWDSKVFIGWAEAGDTGLLTAATGVITQPEDGPLLGFHIPEDGSIDAIAQRTPNTAYAEGTNFTELVAAGGVDGTVANGAAAAGDTMWFDLALRMSVTDASDDAANGSVEFFHRRVAPTTPPPGAIGHHFGGEALGPWVKHDTVLLNQTPTENAVALVPTIEAVNGPTAGVDGVFYLDWWVFGSSRFSRLSSPTP